MQHATDMAMERATTHSCSMRQHSHSAGNDTSNDTGLHQRTGGLGGAGGGGGGFGGAGGGGGGGFGLA